MPPHGLRGRVVLAFAVGALTLSTALALFTYVVGRTYLLNQRERVATQQAYADAAFVLDRFATAGTEVPDALASVDRPGTSALVVRVKGRWFSSSLDVGRESVPGRLRDAVADGTAARMRTTVDGSPAMIVGIPLPAADAWFFEVASLDELDGTLKALSTILGAGAALAAVAGAALGLSASRTVLHPLNAVADTAAQIAGGQLDTRLPPTDDPDLATIIGSFNSMVDSLQQRLERDARFAADVSHELRSPLTTLVTSVEVLASRRDELPARSQRALDLVVAELDRFRLLLDNLLELARAETAPDSSAAEPVPLGDLLIQTLNRSGRDAGLLTVENDVKVRVDKLRLERAFVNLFDNADRHGSGLVRVTLRREDGHGSADQAQVLVDDAGSGVPIRDRERVFERFATSGGARRSSMGTGLGLALAAETVRAHGGGIWCTDRPGGGARFVVSLPLAGP